ncbi:hypothetical protein Acr_00g0030990 [Actinidia rufa]|uniref:Uncharacterized protein n=1 Tax=Actinidia rufa TaxID=165716 RepID=A0A7J0DF02_9ERIC|nr:hypothetical protein Acr_00g0030990 [Actinidia rufa]
MLHPVWPNLLFWYFLGLFSSFTWWFSAIEMDFINKNKNLVGILTVTISFSWYILNVALFSLFLYLLAHPRRDRFFRGYKRAGKTIGSVLLFFGNIGLYYSSEKSIACLLTFLFLAFYCLCALFYIQPYTDFGLLEFLLSASLNQALSLFGLDFNSWVVFIACVFMASRLCFDVAIWNQFRQSTSSLALSLYGFDGLVDRIPVEMDSSGPIILMSKGKMETRENPCGDGFLRSYHPHVEGQDGDTQVFPYSERRGGTRALRWNTSTVNGGNCSVLTWICNDGILSGSAKR